MRKIMSHLWGQIMPASGQTTNVQKSNLKRVGLSQAEFLMLKAGDEEDAGIRRMKAAFL